MRPLLGAVLSSPARRESIFILAAISAVTALAWAYLVHLGSQTSSAAQYQKAMAAMGMAVGKPWTLMDLFFTFTMWAVMMTGMMAPSAAPVLLLFAAAQSKRRPDNAPLITVFTLGYLAIWTAFSAAAALAQFGLHQAAMLSPAMAASSPRLGGAILMAAGLYQLTPWKNRCLAHCRSPLGFLMSYWREGLRGAFHMGFHHGIYCLGCCWALMCVLFAVGAMDLVWVAALTALVLMEKIGPKSAAVARLAGAALMVLGAAMIARGPLF